MIIGKIMWEEPNVENVTGRGKVMVEGCDGQLNWFTGLATVQGRKISSVHRIRPMLRREARLENYYKIVGRVTLVV
jgi:hypothetical protein